MTTTTTPTSPRPSGGRGAGRRAALIAGIIVAALVAAFAAVYFIFFTPDSPEELKLSPGSAQAPAGDLAGAWKVGPGSETGYRVRERLARLPAASDAVGRTSSVTGSLTVAKSGDSHVVESGGFEADLTTLKSDEDRRDNRIRTMGIETDRFPKATFNLTAPVTVPSALREGKDATVPVTGDLTMHGFTKRVTIPVAVAARGTTFEVVGSYTFPFSEFGMEPPSIPQIGITVEPNATMEFKLVLGR